MLKWGKKSVAALLTVLFTLSFLMPANRIEATSAANEIRIYVNHQRLLSDVAPYVVPKKNVTMLPFRAIGEALGATVSWDPETKIVQFQKNDRHIQMTLGNRTAVVNGNTIEMDVAPETKYSRTMVPLRFIGENLGLTVNWDQSSRSVSLITSDGEVIDLAGLRGAWISSVYNIDWPQDPRKGFDADEQKSHFIQMLDQLKDMGMNAVFVQIRPTADSFYPSEYFPWSEWLTGSQGKDPGYDPLAFMIEETHARGMQFHAWINPYRVSVQGDLNKLADDHIARQHPEWVVKHNNKLLFDPGIPEVQQYITDAVMEIVNNYDVDGIHFDDYFYPYGQATEPFKDDTTYSTYNKVFKDKASWRRNNVNQFVQLVSNKIQAANPYVSFGISPFGVWRNSNVDATGSLTNASVTSYDSLHADVRTWVKSGWIDYVAPQIYWHMGHQAADYATLVDWWVNETAGTGVKLYIGHAAYKLADANEKDWSSADVLIEQLMYNEQYSSIAGDLFFSADDLINNTKNVADRLKAYYKQ